MSGLAEMLRKRLCRHPGDNRNAAFFEPAQGYAGMTSMRKFPARMRKSLHPVADADLRRGSSP
jgi:hypothetical protein